MKLEPALLARFTADLDSLADPGMRVGIAVSGGPDSLALLLLASAARPGSVEAATVDHRLRPESEDEARLVGEVCARIGVPHAILPLDWPEAPAGNLQARARERRYEALGRWATGRGLGAIATAHHLDDQAETLLMRIARGAGIGGLAGVQRSRALIEGGGIRLIRPLLGWRRVELHAIVAAAGLKPVDDPSNSDPRFDRSRARELLAATGWIEPERLAAVATNVADAEQALDWTARQAFAARSRRDGDSLTLDPGDLPRELRRRLLLAAIREFGASDPPGPQLMQVLHALDSGGVATLVGLKLEGGVDWRISRAPQRRR